MLAEQRQRAILRRAHSDGLVRVADLVREHRISYATAWRDLDVLVARSLLRRIRGGALPRADGGSTPPAGGKKQVPAAGKLTLAARAAALIHPGARVAVSAGPHAAELARELLAIPRVTVVTNNLALSRAFAAAATGEQNLIVIGGVVDSDGCQTGPLTPRTLAAIGCDVMLLDAYGMAPKTGFTARNLDQAKVDRAMIESSRQLVALADHRRWEMVGVATVAELSRAEVLLTDSALPASAQRLLAAQIGRVIVAE